MNASFLARASASVLGVALLALALPAFGDGTSITTAGQSGWTTPPPSGYLQPAPVPVTPTWSAPPPAPAASEVVGTTTYVSPTTTAPCAPCAPVAAPARSWSGCGLPCQDGISKWHVRGVIGEAFSFGDDPLDNCLYWGADVGRTFCGCWGLDVFYRSHSGQFDRNNPGDPLKDGGEWNHVGVKLTYEHSFGQSRFYWWAGLGPEYFWTDKYINDDDGFGVYGELGIGYVLNETFRIRLGVNAHGVDTDATREDPLNDGSSRWLWIVAPVAQIEIDF